MFVNFAKEQTDDDVLTEVVVGNRPTQTNQIALPVRINPPTIQPPPPVTPPEPSKTPQQQGKSSDSKPKEGQSKKAKASKAKSKEGKSKGEKSSSTAMTRIPRPEEANQASSNGEVQGESSKSSGSKHRAESSSKDPSALFIVDSNTQDSALWPGLVQHKLKAPTKVKIFLLLADVHLNVAHC